MKKQKKIYYEERTANTIKVASGVTGWWGAGSNSCCVLRGTGRWGLGRDGVREQERDGTLQYKLYYETSNRLGNQKEVYREAGSRLYHNKTEAVKALKKKVAQGLLEWRAHMDETLSNIQQVLFLCEE